MLRIESNSDEAIDLEVDTLAHAEMNGLKLHRAILYDADLSYSSMRNCEFRGGYFDWADLRAAKIEKCNLSTSSMRNTHLRGARLLNSKIVGVIFDQANLMGADLSGSDIGYSSFAGANLVGASFLVKRISEANFVGAFYDESTKWPNDFDAISAGMIRVTDRTR